MTDKLSKYEEAIQNFLSSAYDKSMEGIPGLSSSLELAEDYMEKYKSPELAIKNLIKFQQAKCATSGFLTGLGGIITLPVAIPANVASVLYVQIRMVAAIAHIQGYDLKDDQVKTFVFACLTGQSASEVLKRAGIEFGKQVGKAQIKRIPGSVLVKINQKVGTRVITKFGEKGIINLGKMIPLIGGVIGGTFDATGTYIIGKAATNTFKNNGYDKENSIIIDV